MCKFIKHYALEIYTVLAMLFMVITSMRAMCSDSWWCSISSFSCTNGKKAYILVASSI